MNETKENDEYVITSAKDDMLLRLSVCLLCQQGNLQDVDDFVEFLGFVDVWLASDD